MELHTETLDNGIRHLSLAGRLDIEGTGQIDMQPTALATTDDEQRVILDLGGVDYLASIGLGCLIRTAQAVHRRHGRAVLLRPQPLVAKVIEASGIAAQIPVFDRLEDAEQALLADLRTHEQPRES